MRVPLIFSYPRQIVPGTVIRSPVSHLDVFSTILDYLNAGHLDRSDGKSLRSRINKQVWNQFYDEKMVVVETEKRIPNKNGGLTKSLGSEPNFMVRRGRYELAIPKNRRSDSMDMLFDTEKDPYQMNNMLGKKARNLQGNMIGKAEHLKALLLEWMARHDGPEKYYSDPKYNAGEGAGDMEEVRNRRTWRTVDFWQSDRAITFNRPIFVLGLFRQNFYLYIGRTNPGTLEINSIMVRGKDARYFSVSQKSATIRQGEHVRIKVSFASPTNLSINKLSAWIEIRSNVRNKKIPIWGP